MVKFISESHFKATINAFSWFKIAVFILRLHRHHIWGKVFKNGPSEICGRQPLKNLKKAISPRTFSRLSSTNFTWSILEYLSHILFKLLLSINMGININLLSRGWKMFHNNMWYVARFGTSWKIYKTWKRQWVFLAFLKLYKWHRFA